MSEEDLLLRDLLLRVTRQHQECIVLAVALIQRIKNLGIIISAVPVLEELGLIGDRLWNYYEKDCDKNLDKLIAIINYEAEAFYVKKMLREFI